MGRWRFSEAVHGGSEAGDGKASDDTVKATVLAARRLARSPMAAVLFVFISDTPLDREIRMVSACHSIARWLTQAGRLVAILYDSISPHRVRRHQQRHWRVSSCSIVSVVSARKDGRSRGYASGYDNRTSLILFRHPGEKSLSSAASFRRDTHSARQSSIAASFDTAQPAVGIGHAPYAFERTIKRQPRIRLTIRQQTRVLNFIAFCELAFALA